MSEDPTIKGLYHDAMFEPRCGKTASAFLSMAALAAKRFPDRVSVGTLKHTAQEVADILESCGLAVSVHGEDLDGITPGNLSFRLSVTKL